MGRPFILTPFLDANAAVAPSGLWNSRIAVPFDRRESLERFTTTLERSCMENIFSRSFSSIDLFTSYQCYRAIQIPWEEWQNKYWFMSTTTNFEHTKHMNHMEFSDLKLFLFPYVLRNKQVDGIYLRTLAIRKTKTDPRQFHLQWRLHGLQQIPHSDFFWAEILRFGPVENL